jgi:Leucine-rich repeat (LRR) protein
MTFCNYCFAPLTCSNALDDSDFLQLIELFFMLSCFVSRQPETIGSLPSLEELWLDGNELMELPPVSQMSIEIKTKYKQFL